MPLPALPASLKKIMPYIKRAEELDKDTNHPESKAVAYYCRQYAMEQGIALPDQSRKDGMPFLLALMDQLEVEKKGLGAVTPEDGKKLVQSFADRVFSKADEEDQLGVADKGTAKTFYAAGIFYDVLQQFKDLDPEIEKKRKYSKWKASDILTAIKEGRTPAAGGFGTSGPVPDDPAEAAGGGGGMGGGAGDELPPTTPAYTPPPNVPQAPSSSPLYPNPSSPQVPKVDSLGPPPPAYSSLGDIPPAFIGGGGGSSGAPPAPIRSPAPAPAPLPPYRPEKTPSAPGPRGTPTPSYGGGPKQPMLDDAKEHACFAIAAIRAKEVALAIDRLEKAIQCLKQA